MCVILFKFLFSRSCDDIPELFQKMFPDSEIAKKITMGRTKASYCVGDGIGELMAEDLCAEVTATDSGFTILFDETTTNQERKQMDVLIRFYSEKEGKVAVASLIPKPFSVHNESDDACRQKL